MILVTSRPAHELSARDWLAANIEHWALTRPDCKPAWTPRATTTTARLRRPRALYIHALFNRWAVSLFMNWRTRAYHTTTDFIADMAANHDRRAVSAVTSKRFPL